MPNQLGQQYECSNCGTTVLCTKAAEGGVVNCCDQEMGLQQVPKARPLEVKKLP